MNNSSCGQRVWAGWLVVLGVMGMLLAKAAGFWPDSGAVAAAAAVAPTAPVEARAKSSTPAVTPSPVPDLPVLMRLSACDQSDRVGVFQSGDALCHPTTVWTLAEFASQLVRLNVLMTGETLATPPAPANVNCPWVVMHGQVAAGAKVCLTRQGGVYRDQGGAHDADWNWRLNAGGQWMLDRPAAQ